MPSPCRSDAAGYDPVERAAQVAALVCRGAERRYHRFRAARFYGGIATADCLGCPLRCLFCWSWPRVVRPEGFGRLCGPEEVARELAGIARRKGFRQVRISGNEPTLARGHLLRLIELVPGDLAFVLETNGVLLGHDPGYARDLARFRNVRVRVSLKGACAEEFARLTGARPSAFDLPLRALEALCRAGVECHAAVMTSFSSDAALRSLRSTLASIRPDLADFEEEEVALYGQVAERLRGAGLVPARAHDPRRIPPGQV